MAFNSVFPILNQKLFNSYFERQYSTNPPTDTAWYALLNAVLCIGSTRASEEREEHQRTSRLIDYTSDATEICVKYFRNTSCCFNDLLFGEANLMAMQAMTLMVRTLLDISRMIIPDLQSCSSPLQAQIPKLPIS